MTRKQLEQRLNELGVPTDDRKSNGGRVPDNCKYGAWVRKHDPIAFECALRDN